MSRHEAPTVKALNAVKTHPGKTATISYRVSDPSPSCGRATVRIEIKRPDYSVAFRTTLRNVQTNKTLAYRFRNRLPSGHYRYFLSCVDRAGNQGTGTSSRGFRVYGTMRRGHERPASPSAAAPNMVRSPRVPGPAAT